MIKFLRCLLFGHDWKIVKTNHYYDVSYGGKANSTAITKQCSKCKKITEQSLYGVGFLNVEDFE